MELILSSKQRLQAKYGHEGFLALHAKMEELQAALSQDASLSTGTEKGLPSALVYVDDEKSLASYRLRPVNPAKPPAIKALVDRLERRLAAKKQAPRYFLLVGGDDIIPFHRLPNPIADDTWDDDREVYSDSGYASSDEEYVVPERAVGRLPDGQSADPALLLAQLATAIAGHKQRAAMPASPYRLGYSAREWRTAATQVYQPIAAGQRLRTSPPQTVVRFKRAWLDGARLLYFNLHGLVNKELWYGQGSGTYPPAFSPNLVDGVDVRGAVVASEACYGADVMGKDPQTSVALRFLRCGAACFLGSTCRSYGQAETPGEADLLVLYFLQYVFNRLPIGSALLNAKIDYAKRQIRRQGFLDEDDQKTLLEFILYGDPSFRLPDPRR
jgi:hypothetical protein